MAPMTPARERLEQRKLFRAIWRWYRLGGSLDKVIATADIIYATRVLAVLDRPPTEED
jgi:hypothetical protein